MGRDCCIDKGGTRLNSKGIQTGGVGVGSHSVIRRIRGTAGRGDPGVRAAKGSEFKEEK